MRVIAAVLLATGVAHAQAPGQSAPVPPPAPSAVMADRWAVDLSLWFGSLRARTDNANSVGVAGLALAGRYRVMPQLELALDLQLGGGAHNTITTGQLAFDVRYRFLAEQRWNVIALAGLGIATAAGKDAADVDKKGRGALRLGGGVERRFGAWAIEADLELVTIGQNTSVPLESPPTDAYDLARFGVTGLSLSLGGTYYF